MPRNETAIATSSDIPRKFSPYSEQATNIQREEIYRQVVLPRIPERMQEIAAASPDIRYALADAYGNAGYGGVVYTIEQNTTQNHPKST